MCGEALEPSDLQVGVLHFNVSHMVPACFPAVIGGGVITAEHM